ncbi:Uncharacterised protein [Streptococcus pneumoniae]|nr:Uncharacterised protein [Streptococcus pneumoniae]VOU55428.1 Uncharacterised protein [Streptococcus pneumoniae]VOU55748.1 Uncharacterised protein [Streptococcus pneumoniae]VOV01753.1 Uncharacterised protein [Streptococcus pneumoniae]VOV16969.1 Uncharacterised protein [Streptococcus pneumoniae]
MENSSIDVDMLLEELTQEAMVVVAVDKDY